MVDSIRRSAVVMVVIGALSSVAPAEGHETQTGGAAALERPTVSSLRCDGGDTAACSSGKPLRLSGEYLDETREVVFLGRRGRADNRRARPSAASQHRVLVRVPTAARSGPIRVRTPHATARGPRLRVATATPTPPPPAPGGGAFPVRGTHDYGTETNRFGGGRNHKGQDIFAACGTSVVSASDGRVTLAKWHDRAGNYAVIETADGGSQAYMHMLGPATVKRGQAVRAGQAIGQVGETGRASGCHLHFEIWTAPGWYEGGSPIDPLPALRQWEAGG